MIRVLALITASIVAVACGGGDAAPPAETPAPTAAPDAAPATPAPAAAPAATPAPATTQPSALATEEHDVGGVEVALTEMTRAAGDTLNVRWMYTNTSGEDKLLAANAGGWYSPYLLAGDAYLIDADNQKKYLVITDSERRPVTSRARSEFGEVTLRAGETIRSWAKFPAPPADVSEISIHVPGVIPFEGIPISD